MARAPSQQSQQNVHPDYRPGGIKAVGRKLNRTNQPANEFMVPAVDAKGHSAHLGFRVIPGYVREMEVLLSKHKGVFPWDTPSDFLRWCMWRGLTEAIGHLKKIDTGDQELNNLHHETAFMSKLLLAAGDRQRFMSYFADLEKLVKELDATTKGPTGGQDIVRNLLNDSIMHIYGMSGTPWQYLYLDEFKKRFGTRCTKLAVSMKREDRYDGPDEFTDDDGGR